MMTLKNISRRFTAGFQLGPCNLQVNNSETLGILGRNGSGKSTLFNLMTANLDPSEGEISFCDQRFRLESFTLKTKIGYLPQNLNFPPWVNGKELLSYAASLYKLHVEDTVTRALAYWDCTDYQYLPLALCSHGTQKRIGLAVATLHSPVLLFLDEPFSGLDVFHTKALEELLQKRKERGQSNVISTHILPYVAKICDRVIVLQQGEMKDISPWQELPYLQKISALDAKLNI